MTKRLDRLEDSMAWLSQVKALPRYVPKVETVPSLKELVKSRFAFGTQHPELFNYRAEPDRQGVHLPVEYLPTSAQVKSSHKTLPDIINLCGLGVSERFRGLVEDLEPGVHQFHEVPVLMKEGHRAAIPFFATILGHMAEGQVEFVSNIKVEPTTLGHSVIEVPRRHTDDGLLTINRKHTAGWHLWYSWDIYMMMTMSDELKERLDSAGVDCSDYIFVDEARQL